MGSRKVCQGWRVYQGQIIGLLGEKSQDKKIEGEFEEYWYNKRLISRRKKIGNLMMNRSRILWKPFSEMSPPFRFVFPKFDLFDGMADIMEHIQYYHNAMLYLGMPEEKSETIMCKPFTAKFKEDALS